MKNTEYLSNGMGGIVLPRKGGSENSGDVAGL